MQHSES